MCQGRVQLQTQKSAWRVEGTLRRVSALQRRRTFGSIIRSTGRRNGHPARPASRKMPRRRAPAGSRVSDAKKTRRSAKRNVKHHSTRRLKRWARAARRALRSFPSTSASENGAQLLKDSKRFELDGEVSKTGKGNIRESFLYFPQGWKEGISIFSFSSAF